MNYELLAIGIGFLIVGILNGRNTAFLLTAANQLQENTNQQFLHLQAASDRNFEHLNKEIERLRQDLNQRLTSSETNIAEGFEKIARSTELRERIARLEERIEKH